MRRLYLVGLLAAAGHALAGDEVVCEKPEYLMLREAGKSELERGYCRARMDVADNQLLFELQNNKIRRTSAIGVTAEKDKELSASYALSARRCMSVASDYEGALARRFRSKPPPECVNFK